MTERNGNGRHESQPEDDVASIIEDLCLDGLSLLEVAERRGMDLPGLTRWAGQPHVRSLLQALRGLSDTRTALVSARARTDAAHALRRLALDGETRETARKACVDLLRLAPDAITLVSDPPDQPAPPGSHDAVRALLERLADAPVEHDDA
ncbi:MAG: hypothetical protein AAFX05_12490 [Planctomycetota bacterium]